MIKDRGRKQISIFAIGLFLVLSFFCVLQLFLPKQTYEVSRDKILTGPFSAGENVIFDQIPLGFGTYRVEVFYGAESDYVADVYLRDNTVFTGGLKNNGETLYRQKTGTDFIVWLYESTEQMEVILSYKGGGNLQIQGVRFTETYHMWTMLLTVFLACGVLTYLLISYHYVWRRQLSREQKTVIWGIGLIVLFSSFFQLADGALNSIDLMFHYMRIEGVKDGLASGQFPVRIDPEWLYGQGYACSIFYCNLFLMIPAVLRLLGFTVVTASHIFFVILNVATAIVAYRCFEKMLGSYKVGLACSALYTLSTYRIYKLYQTGDVGEGIAMLFFPLIVYGYFRVFGEDPEGKTYKTAWLPLAIGYAGLMQTHILTCEVALLLTVLTLILFIKKVIRKQVFWELFKGAAVAVLLSLWFLVPCVDYYLTQDIHIKNLGARTIQNTGLTLSHLFFHFWQRGSKTPLGDNGAQFTYPVGVGLVLMVGLVVFLILWFNGFSKEKDEKQKIGLGKVAAIFSVGLLLMSLNIFPWDHLQELGQVFAALVSSLQFPTRVLGWATVLLVVVCGVVLTTLEQKGWTKLSHAGLLVVVISVFTSTCYMSEHVLQSAGTFRVYHEKGMGAGYVAGGEYLIDGMNPMEFSYEEPVAPEEVEVRTWEKGALRMKVSCRNVSEAESYMDLPLVNYRGYRCEDMAGTKLDLVSNERHQIRVILPAEYEGTFVVRFVSPVYWRMAEVLSLATLVLLVFVKVKKDKDNKKSEKTAEGVTLEKGEAL